LAPTLLTAGPPGSPGRPGRVFFGEWWVV